MEIVNTYLNVDNMIKSNPLILKINGLDFCNFVIELSKNPKNPYKFSKGLII